MRLRWEIDGGAWVWRRHLFAWEEESVRECSILLHNNVLQDNVHDTWRWQLDLVHGYSVRESYRYITSSGDMVDRNLVDEFGTSIFLQMCLCWCGAFFVIEFLPKTTWRIVVFCLQLTRLVWLVVVYLKPLNTFSFNAIFRMSYGLRCESCWNKIRLTNITLRVGEIVRTKNV